MVGADLVEVSPHYDQPADITARLGNRVVLELLTGMALRRTGATSADVRSGSRRLGWGCPVGMSD